MIDADGSMDPSEMARYLSPLLEYDFVKGSRYIPGGDSDDLTWVRRIGDRGLLAFANVLFGSPFTHLCYWFCAFRRTHLDALALTAAGFAIETQLVTHAVKADLRVKETPSIELSSSCGQSDLHTFDDGQRVLRTLLLERLERRAAATPPLAPAGVAASATAMATVDGRDGGMVVATRQR